MSESRAIAEVVSAVWTRFVSQTPLRRHGDEFELAEFALRAWQRASDDDDPGELLALSALTVVFLPMLMLTEMTERTDDPDVTWLTTPDVPSAELAMEQTGIAAWCRQMGYPLRADASPAPHPAAGEHRVDLDQAFALLRENRAIPTMTNEIDAHALLDRAVRRALPLCRQLLERPHESDDQPSRRDLLVAGLEILANARIAGSTILPAIAWSANDSEGAEAWLLYVAAAIRAGLVLRLCAQTDSFEERRTLVLFDHDDLDVLARRSEHG